MHTSLSLYIYIYNITSESALALCTSWACRGGTGSSPSGLGDCINIRMRTLKTEVEKSSVCAD